MKTFDAASVRGVLLDLDGVLYVGERAIPGAGEALAALRRRDLPYRFITNTTTRTAAEVAGKLRGLGFEVEAGEIFSAVSATRDFLRARGSPAVHLLVRDSVRAEFSGFRLNEPRPDYVVVGDIGAAWDYGLLNRVFNELVQGAELVAMHRNRFWQTDAGLQMDIGAFVAGLEYVTGKEATVIGKPSRAFFELAAASLALSPGEVLMVGDDIDNDVGGAQAAGMRAVLVQTGKYRREFAAHSAVTPDAVLASVADLPGLFD